jgi:tetratricopeptide (TPR) repeat protein
MSEQEAGEHYRAGRDLALRMGDSASLLGITGFYSVLCGLSGRVREYDELAEEADRLSLEIGIPALRMAIIVSTMFARWARGRLTDALALAEEGIAISAEDPTLGAGLSLTSPVAFSHLIKGMALNIMGRPEQAKSAMERALVLAQEHGDLETAGYAKQNFALVAWPTGRMTESERSLAAEALDNAQRTGSTQARVQALACLGVAHLGLGQVDQAIPAFERSVTLALETRTGHEVLPMWQTGLVDALLLAGDHATALDTARDALARAERYGTEAWLPTCHRALADAMLASGESDAHAAARQALESAVAAVTVTGARYELPFIERTREKLALVI